MKFDKKMIKNSCSGLFPKQYFSNVQIIAEGWSRPSQDFFGEDMENDVLGFPDLFDRQRDILFTGSPLFY